MAREPDVAVLMTPSATPCSTRSRINLTARRENSDIYHCLKLLILLKNAHVIEGS